MTRIFITSVFVVAIEAQILPSIMRLMNSKSKHVNLSLETAFLFDPKDANYDVHLIKTLRSFLGSLQHAVATKAKLRTRNNEKYYTLSNFLYDLGLHIIDYSDENIKRFAVALQTVVEDYYPKGTVFHKIVFDPRLKAFIKNTLKEWTETDPKVLRHGLQSMYRVETYDNMFVNLVRALNVVFDEEDSAKLKKFSKKFAQFPKTQKRLESKIDKTLNYIVFERYNALNFTIKSLVLDEIGKVSEYVTIAFKNRTVDPEFLLRKRAFQNQTVLEFISSENASKVQRNASEFSGSERDEFPVNPNDSLEKIIKSSKEDDADDKNEIEREIVLNKAIVIDVKNNAVQTGSGNDSRIS